ncbi:TPA: baseplate assembly protein, partial [Yersinia enterocolitica]|nr:baseplate assembly protein [Yersinia enterocolitica]
MTTTQYLGMSRNTGQTITDADHISQSIADILITPVGSRVMRRAYGSL